MAFSFWNAGRLSYAELCSLHTEDAAAVMHLIGATKADRDKAEEDAAREIKCREVAAEMAAASANATLAEALKLGM